MLLLEKEGTVCDSNGIYVFLTQGSPSKKSRRGKPLSAVGSFAVKWKKCLKYGKRLQEQNYHTSIISCCNKRDIVVPCSTLNYFGNNGNINNNNHMDTNRTIHGNNNNTTNQSNKSSAMYSTHNEGYIHTGIVAGMGQMA